MLKKYTFPRERIFAFNDAVFSIAITLLVLDIELPPYQEFADRGFARTMQNLVPDFIGFFVSFMVIALYWKFYLLISRYIKVFDEKLFQLNVFVLLFVALLPFSTGFFVDHFDHNGPFTFYCGNLVFLGLFLYFMTRIILKRAKVQLDPIDAQWLHFRAFWAVLFWVIFMVISIIWNNSLLKLLIPIIFVVQLLAKKFYSRKFKKARQ
jgi:uncharacterized membrane protein